MCNHLRRKTRTRVSSEACSEKEPAASILYYLNFKKLRTLKKIKTVNVNNVKVELRHDSVVRETSKAKPPLIDSRTAASCGARHRNIAVVLVSWYLLFKRMIESI